MLGYFIRRTKVASTIAIDKEIAPFSGAWCISCGRKDAALFPGRPPRLNNIF